MDFREQVIIEMETRGIDLLLALNKAIGETEGQLDKLADKFREGEGDAKPFVDAVVRGTRALESLKDMAAQVEVANQGMAESIQKIDVGLYKFISDTIKFTDKIRKEFEATVISVDQLGLSAKKLQSDKIDQMTNAAINARKAFEATVITTDQLVASFRKVQVDKINQEIAAAARTTSGFATAAEEAANKQKKMGYAMLNVSYAVQDLQYGMGAVANNIGLVAMSVGNAIPKFASMTAIVGGPAGVGAILMGAGVAADLLYHHWDKVAALFGQGVPPKLMTDTKELEERLKKLTEKQWKTEIDFRDMDTLKKKIEEVTEAEAAYQRLKTGKTQEQQKRSGAVSEAIIEGGGAGDYEAGVDNIVEAVKNIVGDAESGELTDMRARQKRTRGLREATARGGGDATVFDDELADLEKQITARAATEKENRHLAARGVVTGAAEGKESDRARLAAMFQANPQAFAAQGIDPLRFGAGLEMAAPDQLFAEERRKHAEETKKKDEALQAKRDADKKRLNNEEDRLREKVETEKSDVLEAELLELEAKDKFQSREFKQRRAEQSRAGKTERGRIQKAMHENLGVAARDQAGQERAANRLDDGIAPVLQNAFAQNRVAQLQGGGTREADLSRALEGHVRQFLRDNGQDPRLADEMVRKAFEEMSRQFLQNQAMTGDAMQSLALLIASTTAKAQAQAQGLAQTFTKINQMGGNMQRNRNMKPSQSMTFGF